MRVRTPRQLVALLLTAVAAAVGTVALAAPAHAARPFYRINNYKSNKCLQPQSSSFNALIEQRTCNTWDTRQQWTIEYSPGTFDIVFTNVWSGLCLDIQVNDVGDIVPGVRVQQFGCAPAQYITERWFETRAREQGYVQIPSRANTSMCLDINNNSGSNGALVVLNRCAISDEAQAFKYQML